MVIDTSAILSILFDEPGDAKRCRLAIDSDSVRLLSAASELESYIVVESRFGPEGVAELDLILQVAEIESVAVNVPQIKEARRAYRLFGKGRHKAGLNFGDCFSYALAAWSNQPLLFTGDDFSETDITPA